MTNPDAQPGPRLTRRRLVGGSLVGTGVLVLGTAAWRVFHGVRRDATAAGLVLSEREMTAVNAFARGYFPPGNLTGIDGRTAGVAGYVDRYLHRMRSAEQNLVRGLILAMDQGTAFAGHWRPARDLTTSELKAYLHDWEQSRALWRRSLAMSLRTILGMAFFTHPQVQAALGIEPQCTSRGPSLWSDGAAAGGHA